MKKLVALLSLLLIPAISFAQMPDAPPRAEGEGPFDRLIIRGVHMIDGTGSPATGPVDIVVEGNRHKFSQAPEPTYTVFWQASTTTP